MSQETQEQTLEQTLNRTDLGQVINDNKKPIIIGLVTIVVAVLVYSFIRSSQASKKEDLLNTTYEFTESTLVPFLSAKLNTDEFLKKLQKASFDNLAIESILPDLLAVSKKLKEQKKTVEVRQLLERVQSRLKVGSLSRFYVDYSISQVLVDANKSQDAIKLLESLKKSSHNILKSSVLLDLAVLYLDQKNIMQAKENLNIIVKDFKDSPVANQAQVYLKKIEL